MRAAPRAAAIRRPVRRRPPRPARPAFIQGSLLRHVFARSAAATAGIMAVAAVDLLTMVYVALQGDESDIAAMGLVQKILFFPYALNIGLCVGISALIAHRAGRGEDRLAKEAGAAGLIAVTAIGFLFALAGQALRLPLIDLFGAVGPARQIASRLLVVMWQANVFLAFGMAAAAVLRAFGKARAALIVALSAALVDAVLDPLLILYWGQGTLGAAYGALAARVVFAVTAGALLVRHGLPIEPKWKRLRLHLTGLAKVAAPPVIANLALAVAGWFVTLTIWKFGVGPAAAAGVFDRIMPFAFAGLSTMAPAVGPIFAQNLAVSRRDRVVGAFHASVGLALCYGALVTGAMWALHPFIEDAFGLQRQAAEFFSALSTCGCLAWLSTLLVLVAGSLFDKLDRPWIAPVLNGVQATVGTIPVVAGLAYVAGARGVAIGLAASGVVFAGVAVWLGRRLARADRRTHIPA